MIPSRQAGDILSGMWQLITEIGRVTKTLVWDRESAIGGTGRVSAPAAAFAGTLATTDSAGPAGGVGLSSAQEAVFPASSLTGAGRRGVLSQAGVASGRVGVGGSVLLMRALRGGSR